MLSRMSRCSFFLTEANLNIFSTLSSLTGVNRDFLIGLVDPNGRLLPHNVKYLGSSRRHPISTRRAFSILVFVPLLMSARDNETMPARAHFGFRFCS